MWWAQLLNNAVAIFAPKTVPVLDVEYLIVGGGGAGAWGNGGGGGAGGYRTSTLLR